MTLMIELPRQAERRLVKKAKVAGVDVPTYVRRILQADAARPALDQILAPVRKAFKKSGMSEDELGDLLVKAKKRMRSDRIRQAH